MSAGPPLPFDRLLWLAASPEPARVRDALLEEARRYVAWSALPTAAEAHGIAPLVERHLGHEAFAGVVPTETLAALKGLFLRHKRANAIRRDLIAELSDSAERDGTPMLFLKGGALAFDVYGDPARRSMRDLDVLVCEADLGRVGARLASLGYEADDEDTWADDRSHWHHQPARKRIERGLTMTIEVHRQLGIDDPHARRRYEDLEKDATSFELGSVRVRTLGPTDMLLHVHYHGFRTPLEWPDRARLVSAADLVALVDKRHAEIEWMRVRAEAPHLVESLAWLHTLTPFSDDVARLHAFGREAHALRIDTDYRGKGRERDRERPDRLRHWMDTLFPPVWWLRVRHGGAPGVRGLAASWALHLRELL